MIIDISGRTDIVNYYSEWMFKRFEAGFVYSRNSLFPNPVRRYEIYRLEPGGQKSFLVKDGQRQSHA